MLKLVKHKNIDKGKWDECISKSPENIIYAISWYLSLVSPNWDAYILEENKSYKAVMPLPVKRKFGLPLLIQPIFAQQLGVFSIEENSEFLPEALKKIQKNYLLLNYSFNSFNTDSLNKINLKNSLQTRITYILSLSLSYHQIIQNYSTNHKRNIKKGLANGIHITESDDLPYLVQLFRTGKGVELNDVKDKDYNTLIQLFLTCKNHKTQKLFVARDKANNIIAGGLFIVFQKRIIYLFGVSNTEGKETGAMTLIFDEIIKLYSESDFILDFEGGEIEGIGRFYRGFGATPSTYLKILNSRIPFLKAK